MSDSEVSILIVDDDEIDARAVERALRRQRIANPVYTATDGKEGLAMLRGEEGRAKVPRPYLILLDLNMPRMNGLQFLRELRGDAKLSDSIVFVLSSSREEEDQGGRVSATYCRIFGETRSGEQPAPRRANAGAVRAQRAVPAGAPKVDGRLNRGPLVDATNRTRVSVLMVDDDLVDRRAVRRALGASYVVTEAENGPQARQSFDSAPPDCVLLDYNIPGTNTLELLDHFRQYAPVVMLTGQDDIGAAVAVMKAGAQDYLNKNEFTPERLDRAIQGSIDKADRKRKEIEARGRLRNEYRTEKRRRRQLEASLQVARDIQQNLLPSSPPEIAGFDFCCVCLPIEETAGDFFDYFPMEEGTLGVVVGDVSGHGIGPALLTAETRAYLRALSRTNSDVGAVTTIVNRLLWDDVLGGRFLTLFYGRLDPTSRTLTYSCAGHPAYIIHPSGRFTLLDSDSPPLGMISDLVIPTSAPMPLAKGDILFVATDGLFETTAPSGALLGRDFCLRLVAAHSASPVEKIVDELLHAAHTFADGLPLHDDVTIVVAKAK